MTESTKLRLALVGAGAIAEELHIPCCQTAQNVELVALVDSQLDRAQQLGEKFRIPLVTSNMPSIASDIDAVILATPPHTHLPLTEEACSLALHVLCEKPLANTVRECELMCQAAAKTNCMLATAHVYRFWPSRSAIYECIQTDAWGRIQSVRVSQGRPYTWGAATGYTVRKEMVSGGVLINAGIHPLDSLLWWFGDPLGFEYQDDAIGGLESNVRLRMEFPSNINCRFRQSRTCHLKHEILIETEAGTITLPTHDRTGYFITQGHQPRRVDCASPEMSHLQPGIQQIEDFANAILQRKAPRVSGTEGTRVISLIEGCYESKRQTAWSGSVPLPGATW